MPVNALRLPPETAEALAPVARRTALSASQAPTRKGAERTKLSVLEDSSALRWRHGERLDAVIEEACRRFADRDAVSVGGVAVTFAELNARADQMARFFTARGVKAGDRIGVLLDRGAEAYVALFALLKIRASYVPLDPNHPADRIRYILADAGAKLVVAHMRLADRFQDLETGQIVLDRARDDIAAFDDSPLCDEERGETGERLCYVLYTSGTTGRPKGVAVAHPSICNFVRVAAELYGFGPGERVYQGMSIAFDFSIEELWVPLAAGATLVPNLAAASLFGEELAEFLEVNDVTCFCCVPTLLASIERELPKLKILLIGGEACPPAIVKRWSRAGRTLLNSYGPTETTVTATLAVMTPDKPVTIGKPLPTYSIVILDAARNEALEWGEAGEIGIAGIGVAEGYLNRAELTDAKFIPDFLNLTRNRSGRIYRTGDLGRLTADGEIEYLGRIDTQVKLRGYRIELTEIESVLLEIANVSQVVAATFEPVPGSPELVAYYSVKHGAEAPRVDDMVALMRERLPAYMTPAYLERLPFIPTLVSNKADRSKLPAPKSPRLSLNARHSPPATPTEHLLARAFQETMNLASVSVDADFFNECGAHSLLMARFCAKIRQVSPKTSVAMRDVYANPNVRRLAAALDSAKPGEAIVSDYGPAHAPGDFAHLACGAAQGAALVAELVLAVAAAWATVLWTADAPSLSQAFLRDAAAVIGAFLGLNALAIAAKWALVGRTAVDSIDLWSAAYFRFWLAKHLTRFAPANLFLGTPVYAAFLRALGAQIGPRAVILTRDVPAMAHRFRVGADALVSGKAVMRGYVAAGNRLRLGDVAIGANAFVGVAAVMDFDTAIGDFAQLGHVSSLQAGQRVPDGKRYHGSPAEECETSFRLADEAPCPSARRWIATLASMAAKVAVLAGSAAAAVYALAPLASAELMSEDAGWIALAGPSALIAVTALAAEIFGGLALVGLLPRALNLFLREGRAYPLFGFHHAVQTYIEETSNVRFFNRLFGDSVFIERYLRFIGWRLGEMAVTGSNFGTNQTHQNPFLCSVGAGTITSDGLAMINVAMSSSAFRLGECRIGDRNFLGTDVRVFAGSRVGDNCLLGSKVLAPLEGPVRHDTGLLGSPAFEIPRVAARDCNALAAFDASARAGQVRRKTRHNLGGMAMFLGVTWATDFFAVYAASIAFHAEGGGLLATELGAAAALLASAAAVLLFQHGSVGFRRLSPQTVTVFERGFWRIERYWKLNEGFVVDLFAGTPFRPLLLRALGARVGRKVFDDGATMTEPPLVEIADGANLNAHSIIQSHSLEEGVYKSDFIRIGRGASVGVSTLVHYGVTMEEGAILDADSFLMKGETAPAGSRWRGNPAQMVGAAQSAAFLEAAE